MKRKGAMCEGVDGFVCVDLFDVHVWCEAPWECHGTRVMERACVGEWEEVMDGRVRRPLQRLYQANLIPLLQPISRSTLAPCEPSGPLHCVSNNP